MTTRGWDHDFVLVNPVQNTVVLDSMDSRQCLSFSLTSEECKQTREESAGDEIFFKIKRNTEPVKLPGAYRNKLGKDSLLSLCG